MPQEVDPRSSFQLAAFASNGCKLKELLEAVTSQAFETEYAFCRINSSQDISGAGAVHLDFSSLSDTKLKGSGSWVSTGYTVEHDGTFKVRCQVAYTGTLSLFTPDLHITKNGTLQPAEGLSGYLHGISGGNQSGCIVEDVIDCVEGDVLGAAVVQDAAVIQTISIKPSGSTFQVTRLDVN